MGGYFLLFLIGYFLFRLFASGSIRFETYYQGQRSSFERPKDFETSLLVLASVIIKADGVVNKTELNYVRNYFTNTYGKEKANQAFRKFREVIKQQISTRQTCSEIGKFMPYQARVQLIKFLFGVAYSDGQVTQAEELEIRKIASYMLIGEQDYLYLRAIYFQNHRQQRQQTYSSTYSKSSDYEYEVLGLTEKASNEQIKKAYRTLVKKYHPDRLQNASKQDRIVAKEKFQKIQSAYEKIKEERGL